MKRINMKHSTVTNSLIRCTGVLGLTSLLAGAISLAPAHADNYRRDNRDHNQIRRDIVDIRRDQDHLHDLYRRREFLASHHDWREVHRVEDEIARLKRHIDHDRQDVRQDAQRYHRDQYQDYNRGRDRYERNGSNTGYNADYRAGQANYRDRDDNGRGEYRVH